MSEKKNKEIFLGPEKYPLKLEIKSFKGKKYLDIRKWFFDKKTNEVLPTKKGIMLSHYQFNDVIEAIQKQQKIINDWFQDKVYEEDVVQKLSYETSKIRAKSQEAKNYKTILKKIDNKSFFSIEYKNNEINFILNKDHEFFKKIDDFNEENKKIVLKLVESILISFKQSLEIFDPETKYKLEDLEDLLNYNWSKILTNYLRKI